MYENSVDVMTNPRQDPGSLLVAGWVTLRLLLRPSAAGQIVARTVQRYSLGRSAVERIRDLDGGDLLC